MNSFTDTAGRTWIVRVDVAGLKRIRAALQVNLGDVDQLAENLHRIRTDDLFVAEAAWLLCQDEAAKPGIQQAQFEACIAGNVTAAAADAILAGLADFFRYPAARSATQRMRELSRDQSRETSGNSSTDAPASSASTPAPSPSAS